MRNASAFPVDPCPRDLLGKQWLFMHMSAHYRKMFAAQSVVDSSPPASMAVAAFKGRAGPRCARRPLTATAVDYSEGHSLGSARMSPRPATSSSLSARSSRSSRSSRPLPKTVIQQVLLRQSVRTQRSAQFSKPARLTSKPSRADTDPGPGRGPVLEGRSSHRRSAYDGVGVGLRKPPLQTVARRRREREKPDTYYDKLNQLVPDNVPQRFAVRPTGQYLSEVFTPKVPHKPQVLRTEVQSRLRFSNDYCPPRPKQLRSKSAVSTQEVNKDATQPVWIKSQSSPPVSSRDSAYNGGISSGGESRGPTPDQKGVRKNSKRSGVKGKNKIDQSRSQSAESKTRRKLENKLKKRLIEEERHEMQEQRLRVDPWTLINQDDHGDELLRDIHSQHTNSHGDDSLTENGSPENIGSNVEDGSLTDQSIEEDMAEEAEERSQEEESHVENGATFSKKDDSYSSQEFLTKQPSSSSQESVKNQPPRQSPSFPKKLQVGTQTELHFSNLPNGNQKIIIESCSKSSSSKSQNSPKCVSPVGEIIPTVKQPAMNQDSRSQSGLRDTELISSQTTAASHQTFPNLEPIEISKECENEMHQVEHHPIPLHSSVTEKVRSEAYLLFVNNITKDVLAKRVTTNKGLKALFHEHIDANSFKLDKVQMQQEVDKLRLKLGIPRDDYLDSINYGVGPMKSVVEALSPSPLDVENLRPIVTSQSSFWVDEDLHDQPIYTHRPPIFSPAVLPQFDRRIDSPIQSITTGAEELQYQQRNRTSEKSVDIANAVPSKANGIVPNAYGYLKLQSENSILSQHIKCNSPQKNVDDDVLQTESPFFCNSKSVIEKDVPLSEKHDSKQCLSLACDTRGEKLLEPFGSLLPPPMKNIETKHIIDCNSPPPTALVTRKESVNTESLRNCEETIGIESSCHHHNVSICTCGEDPCQCENLEHISKFFTKWLADENLDNQLGDESTTRKENNSSLVPDVRGKDCKCSPHKKKDVQVISDTIVENVADISKGHHKKISVEIIYGLNQHFSSKDSVEEMIHTPNEIQKKIQDNKQKALTPPAHDSHHIPKFNDSVTVLDVLENVKTTSQEDSQGINDNPHELGEKCNDHVAILSSCPSPNVTGVNSDISDYLKQLGT